MIKTIKQLKDNKEAFFHWDKMPYLQLNSIEKIKFEFNEYLWQLRYNKNISQKLFNKYLNNYELLK